MESVNLENISSGGQKILSLARLLRAGLPVPRGFAIRRDEGENEIPLLFFPKIKKEYESLAFGQDLANVDARTLDIIRAGREKPHTAVRGDGFSFLNVGGLVKLESVLNESISLGAREILVQKMVDSEKTALLCPHPTKDLLQIESSWGLELLDETTPDLFEINKQGKIRSYPGHKPWLLTRDPLTGASVRVHTDKEKAKGLSLTEDNIRKLLSIRSQVEEILGPGQAIELAFERNRPQILQAWPFHKQNFDIPQKEGNLLVKGKVISPGSAKGPARIVNSPEDLKKVQPGDIIVSPSFRKEFLAAQASGIILRSGPILKLRGKLSIPSLRAPAELEEGQEILLDAVNGKVFSL